QAFACRGSGARGDAEGTPGQAVPARWRKYMRWVGSSKVEAAGRSGIVTVLDVGSSKVCCVIGRLRPREESEHLPGRTHAIKVIGIGHQKALGIKSGVIVDLALAEQSIRLAVDAAERMAG